MQKTNGKEIRVKVSLTKSIKVLRKSTDFHEINANRIKYYVLSFYKCLHMSTHLLNMHKENQCSINIQNSILKYFKVFV